MHAFKNFLALLRAVSRQLFPSCRDVSRLQSDALDRPLSPSRRLGLRLHLLACGWCRRYGRQIAFLKHAVHEHSEELTDAEPNTLSPEARERLERALRTETE